MTALSYPLRGLKICWGTKELRRLAFIPVLLHACFFILFLFSGYTLFHEQILSLTEMGDTWYQNLFENILYVLLLLLSAGVSALLSFIVTTICASTVFEHLSRKTEELLCSGNRRKEESEASFSVKGMFKAMLSEFKKTGVFLLSLLLLLPLHLIPGIGSALYMVLFTLCTSFFLAYDYFSHTLSRYGFEYNDMKHFLFSHTGTTFGFGLGCFGLLLIPFAGIVISPATVVGGTLLLHKTGFQKKDNTDD